MPPQNFLEILNYKQRPIIWANVDVGCRQHSVVIGLSNVCVPDEFDIFHSQKSSQKSW